MKHSPILMPSAVQRNPSKNSSERELDGDATSYEIRPTKEDPEILNILRDAALLANLKRSEFARNAIRAAHERIKAGQPIEGLGFEVEAQPQTFTAPYLGSIPCGPWSASDESKERFSVTTEVADELEARDGDWWFRATGDSMVGAGILDSSLVLVRPYEGKPPRRGDVVALQIVDEAGEVVGTFKRFDGQNGDVPKLLDGNDEPFALPEGARVQQILARGVGVVSRL